jgi:hypothetical protein
VPICTNTKLAIFQSLIIFTVRIRLAHTALETRIRLIFVTCKKELFKEEKTEEELLPKGCG